MTSQLFTRLHDLTYPIAKNIHDRNWDQYTNRIVTKLTRTLDHYAPITLDEMKCVALLDRMDTKFVFHIDTLYQVLANLADRYQILQIADHRIHTYRNLYFDTPQLDMFNQHQRQQRDRYKVRCRAYTDTQLTFLEVKLKNNFDRTIKSRLETSSFIEELPGIYDEFLSMKYPGDSQNLKPVLWNDFSRLTLVDRTSIERLTIDVNLGFSDGWARIGLPGLVVAEVKQENFSVHSDFMVQMRTLGVQPRRFSKYCMGIPTFYPQVKANRFKPRVILIERIMNQGGQNGNIHGTIR